MSDKNPTTPPFSICSAFNFHSSFSHSLTMSTDSERYLAYTDVRASGKMLGTSQTWLRERKPTNKALAGKLTNPKYGLALFHLLTASYWWNVLSKFKSTIPISFEQQAIEY